MTTPPHDLDAERSVLGSILISVDQPPEVVDAMALLTPASWYHPAHRLIYTAMQLVDSRSEPIDENTVKSELKSSDLFDEAGGYDLLLGLSDNSFTSANILHYAKIVHAAHLRRQMITHADAARNKAEAGTKPAMEMISDAATAFADLAAGQRDTDPVPIKDLVKAEMIDIEKRRDGGVVGLETGFRDVDHLLGGLDSDDLMIIAARPGMGKTALALNIAAEVAIRGGTGVLIFSLEMGKEQVIQRLIASTGRVNGMRIKTGHPLDYEWPKLGVAAGKLAEAPIWIDDGGDVSVMEIRAKARRIQQSHGLGLIVVDYIQLMSGSGSQNRERDVAEITRGLKMLGKELGTPVIALSQLNRGVESRTDKRPMLGDLRESGAIEQDASKVTFLYRDDYYNDKSPTPGVAEFIVAKNRSGSIGKCEMGWDGRYTAFATIEQPKPTK